MNRLEYLTQLRRLLEDGGIGSINFDIDGCKNDYKIKSDSKVKINSTTEENELLYKIKLDIDNGIGEISLNFR